MTDESCIFVYLQTERQYGGLKDEDRIFTNLYGEQSWRLKDAMKRVRGRVFSYIMHSFID